VRVFIVAWLWIVPTGAFAQPEGWRKFAIPETGANVDFPAAIFNKDVGRPDQGYGHRYMTADGRATFALQSIPNGEHDSPAAFLAKKNPPTNIKYKRITNQFFVISSFRNNSIWYDRCNFNEQLINCVMVNYPTAEKRRWDSVITRISRSLSP
jgi:hypothetical protein